jgi:hypothetical protein
MENRACILGGLEQKNIIIFGRDDIAWSAVPRCAQVGVAIDESRYDRGVAVLDTPDLCALGRVNVSNFANCRDGAIADEYRRVHLGHLVFTIKEAVCGDECVLVFLDYLTFRGHTDFS